MRRPGGVVWCVEWWGGSLSAAVAAAGGGGGGGSPSRCLVSGGMVRTVRRLLLAAL